MRQDKPDWVELAANGSKAAFSQLYERHVDEIFRFVTYRVNNSAAAEEITGQVFLKAWQNLPKFEQRSSFRSWVFRMAHNAVIDHYRTRKAHRALEDGPAMIDPQPTPEMQLLREERIDHLRRILSQLSPAHQEVLTLRFIVGLSPEQVAEVMERSAGAVRVLQHRALKAAREVLVAEGGMA